MSETHRTDGVEDTYTPDQDRSLSMAVIQAVETYLNTESGHSAFTLYDNIDPDALDELFRHDATPETKVVFNVKDAWVTLWGDGGVKIHVADTPVTSDSA